MERRQVPLKVVPDKIAAPPGTARIQFGGGIIQLQNGNQLQIAAVSITISLDASGFTPAQFRDLAELVRRGTLGMDSSGNICLKASAPASPPAPGTPG